MTESSLKNITADGITGEIFALEGIKDTVVLLNGPMGCRFYHSSGSQNLMPRSPLYLPSGESGNRTEVSFSSLNSYFFRQARVPCTWLDSYDYVYGTEDKARAAMEYIRDNVDLKMFALVNSPGASLIGDELTRAAKEVFPSVPTVIIESPGFSLSYAEGTGIAALEVLKQSRPFMKEKRTDASPSVNIIGESLWHKYSEGNIEEIRRLLALCGIRVNAVLTAGSSPEEILSVKNADLNIVLYPEMGREAALWLEREFSVPCFICETPPVGFEATERFITKVASLLNCDPSAVLRESEKARAQAYWSISRIFTASGRPNGTVFAVKSFPSEEKAYASFLTEYLGMQQDTGDIAGTNAEIVFSDANVIGELMSLGKTFCGVEIANPTMGYVDVIPKVTLGLKGALFLTEQVLNAAMTRDI